MCGFPEGMIVSIEFVTGQEDGDMPVVVLRALSATGRRLVDAGRTLVREFGFAGVAVDAVIREAGLSKSTFYNHFEGKDDLFARIVAEEAEWWGENLRSELSRLDGDDPYEHMLMVFDLVDHRQDGSNCGNLLFAAMNSFTHPNEPVKRIASVGIDRLRGEFRALVGEAFDDDVDERFEVYWLLIAASASRARVSADRSRRLARRLMEGWPTA